MTRQKEILIEIAKKHGITMTQAEEVWEYFVKALASEIESPKRVDGIYDPSKFKVIHVINFGKFIPNTKYINLLNTKIKNKQNEKS